MREVAHQGVTGVRKVSEVTGPKVKEVAYQEVTEARKVMYLEVMDDIAALINHVWPPFCPLHLRASCARKRRRFRGISFK